MYSYEDRIRAVTLYIQLGKRVAATIQQLGYPTKNSLKSWHREYEQGRALKTAVVRPPKFTAEQKARAVEHYLTHGRCVAFTIKALGYPGRASLHAWVQELNPRARPRLLGASSNEQKHAAVLALCTRQGSIQAIADDVGVCRETLYNWRNQLLGPEALASMKRFNDSSTGSELSQLEQQLQTLRRQVRRLQLEQELLKKANELLKKDHGIDLHLVSNREKTLLVDALRHEYSLAELLTSLVLARSSYFYHRARLNADEKYFAVRRTITDIFERNHGCYGYRRIQASLVRQCVWISEKVVRRLMKQEGLVAAAPKRRRYGSYLGEISPAPENLLNRDFNATAPNQKWLTDISEFQLPVGKVYLSPMIDCFDGMVVSWSIGTRPDAELVNTMLDAAIAKLNDSEVQPMVHSDRGAHYRWPGWLSRIADAKLVRSMSRKGYSPDNAACEGFFGRLKNELFYARDWQTTSIEQFTQALDAYIRWYNEQRIKISLGARSPVEYRRALGIAA